MSNESQRMRFRTCLNLAISCKSILFILSTYAHIPGHPSIFRHGYCLTKIAYMLNWKSYTNVNFTSLDAGWMFVNLFQNANKFIQLSPQVIPVVIFKLCTKLCWWVRNSIPQTLTNDQHFWFQIDNIWLNLLDWYLKWLPVWNFKVEGKLKLGTIHKGRPQIFREFRPLLVRN